MTKGEWIMNLWYLGSVVLLLGLSNLLWVKSWNLDSLSWMSTGFCLAMAMVIFQLARDRGKLGKEK